VDELTLTNLSQCWAPVCLMKPGGALIAETVPRSAIISLLNSGRRCEAHLLVVCTTCLARIAPRSVSTVIQPLVPRGVTFVTGVWAYKLRLPFLSRMRRIACTNLYAQLSVHQTRRKILAKKVTDICPAGCTIAASAPFICVNSCASEASSSFLHALTISWSSP
jgi:hypothetical protein